MDSSTVPTPLPASVGTLEVGYRVKSPATASAVSSDLFYRALKTNPCTKSQLGLAEGEDGTMFFEFDGSETAQDVERY